MHRMGITALLGVLCLTGITLQAAPLHASSQQWSLTRLIPAPYAMYPTLSPDESTLYVGDGNSTTAAAPNGRLWAIDTATNSSTAITNPSLSVARGSAISPDGSTLLIANWANPGSVLKMDTTTRTFSATGISPTDTPAPNSPLDVFISPNGAIAMVPIQSSDAIGFLQMSDLTAIRSPVSVGASSSPRQIAFTSDSSTAYITLAGLDQVAVRSVATGAPLDTIAVGDLPNGIAITPDGTEAWVANTNDHSLSVIDLSTNAVSQTISMQVNDGPFGLAFTPDGRSAIIANRNSGTVSIIDRATRVETQRVVVGGEPRGVVITRNGLRAFVGAGDNGVAVLDFAPTQASGPNVPTAALQQFTRSQGQSCANSAPDIVNWPGLGPNVQHESWGESWAQWPNDGRGGFVCSRQPYYTTIGTWALS